MLNADTYNEVLRDHHFRQTQFKSCISLLQELPIFKRAKLAALTSIVCKVMHQTYPRNEVLVREGSVIKNILLILSGDVKVYSSRQEHQQGKEHDNKRFSRIAISILGRGQLIGESEVIQNPSSTFEFTYEAASSSVEALAIPRTVFLDALNLQGIKNTSTYKDIEASHEMRQVRLFERADRAYEAMKSFSISKDTSSTNTNSELAAALPTVGMRSPRRMASFKLSSHRSLLQSLESSLPSIDRPVSRPGTARSIHATPRKNY